MMSTEAVSAAVAVSVHSGLALTFQLVALCISVLFGYLLINRLKLYGAFQITIGSLVVSIPLLDKEGWSPQVIVLAGIVMLLLVTSNFGTLAQPQVFLCWCMFALAMMVGGVSDLQNQLGMMLAWLVSIPAVFLILSSPNQSKNRELAVVGVPLTSVVCSLVMLSPFARYVPLLSGLNVWKDEWGNQRFLGPLQDFELTAELMVICSIVSLQCAIDARTRKGRILFSAQYAILIAIGLLSGSRSFPLLAGPGLLVICWFNRKRIGKSTAGLFIGLAVGLVVTFGGTTMHRLREVEGGGSLASSVNRQQVWAIYEASVSKRTPIFGNGPLFPWAEYGIYPHSLSKSILYLGGYLALFLFILLLITTVRAILRDTYTPARLAKFVVLSLFLVDEYKVEFTRRPNYVVLVACVFAYLARDLKNQSDTSTIEPKQEIAELQWARV